MAKTAPKSGGGTVTTTYVYTADGTLAAEYSSDLLPSECGVQTCFVTADQVGSTRLVTDSAGNVTRWYDYLPFGSELNTGVGGRTAAMGYAAAGTDTFEVKYAGQVRDAETGLDQMGLRMYSPEQGRFIGVDPDNAGAVAGVPDTWNGYAYVGNNPLNFTDPSGESWWSALGGVVAGIGTFLGTGNPALAFTVGKTVFAVGETAEALAQGRVPGVDLFSPGGGTSPFACGGPLGNCGSIGGVWTEQGLGPNVQDPGRFVSEYNSYRHVQFTVYGGFAAGLGFASLGLGVSVVEADKGTQGTSIAETQIHAMSGISPSGRYQTCTEAFTSAASSVRVATAAALSGRPNGLAQAVHTIQDSYAHDYQEWRGGLFPGWAHEYADAQFDVRPIAATAAYIRDVLAGTPRNPDAYLARPGCR